MWSADDISGNDGDNVTSWTDQVGSMTISQGSATLQPTLQTEEVNEKNTVLFA